MTVVTMGKSGVRGVDGLWGANAPSRSSLALADGYHLGLPVLMTNWQLKYLYELSHLLNVCTPSDTDS